MAPLFSLKTPVDQAVSVGTGIFFLEVFGSGPLKGCKGRGMDHLEVVEGGLEAPDAQDAVLAGGGQEAAAGRELHAPDGAEVFAVHLLDALQRVELVGTLVAAGRLHLDVLLAARQLVGDVDHLLAGGPARRVRRHLVRHHLGPVHRPAHRRAQKLF